MKGHAAAIAFAAAASLSAPAVAQDCIGEHAPGTVRLAVEVSGVRPPQGEVAITVYPDDRRRFLARGGKLVRARIKTGTTASACFWLPPASYAVVVYHDKDGDHNFDRTLMGMPREGFGFSNDPETKMGLPPLSAVRFPVGPNGRTVSVHMKYLRSRGGD
jgi:uncharacterized protein (DUF2141 family)